MRERKLKVNLEPLWTETDRFVLRYQDMSEDRQKKLAKRIWQCTRYIKIRHLPDVSRIEESLHEINPIIFAESAMLGLAPNDTRAFNICWPYSRSIGGSEFHSLCRCINLLLFRKKDLTMSETVKIANCSSTGRTDDYIISQWDYSPQRQTRRTIEEVSLADIEYARRQAENHNNN